jgi:hypothetical protein
MPNIGCYLRAALGSACAFAQTPPPCPRPAAGSIVAEPDNLFSRNGVLSLAFNYFTQTDSDGRTLYCFVTSSERTPNLDACPRLTPNTHGHALLAAVEHTAVV